MSSNSSSNTVSTAQLILVPAIITLAVTILRLVGELQNWPPRFFSREGGGGFALVGIWWLAPLFGIYFAIKLVHAGEGPVSSGRGILFSILAILPVIGGMYCVFRSQFNSLAMVILGFALVAAGALIPALGWRKLFSVQFAYAFAARIPVLIVMFIAIQNNWGTHYDVAPPNFPAVGVLTKFFYIAFLPQMIMWIAYTTITGSLFGSIAAIFAHQPNRVPQTA